MTKEEYLDAVQMLIDNCTSPNMAEIELNCVISGDFETADFLAYVRNLNNQLHEPDIKELAVLERKL